MNFIQKLFCPCPSPQVEAKIEVIKEVVKEVKVPVFIDPGQYRVLVANVKLAWERILELEAECKEAGLRVIFENKEPDDFTSYGGRKHYIGKLADHNMKIVANLYKEF